MSYQASLAGLLSPPLLIGAGRVEALAATFALRMAAIKGDAAAIREVAAGARRDRATRQRGRIAVLGILGPLVYRGSELSDFAGFASTATISAQFDQAIASPEVKAIVLDVDSVGGELAGVKELADKIYVARGKKPIVAVANTEAGSAAYWIATAADELVVTPSGQVGGVGALAIHIDVSAANEKLGLKPTYVTYGEHKAEFTPDRPLSPEARAEAQRVVDTIGRQFESDVARNWRIPVDVARIRFGGGRMFVAKEAVARKLADRVETLEQTIRRVASSSSWTGRGHSQREQSIEACRRRLAAYKRN
jgi:signal peptide peptidase SppA